jgi:hypothetical protein
MKFTYVHSIPNYPVPMDIDEPNHVAVPMDIDHPIQAFPIPIVKKPFVPTQIIEHIYSDRMITDEPPNKVIIRSIV